MCHRLRRGNFDPTEVEEIFDRWYQGDQDPLVPAADYYKVATGDKKIYILKHDITKDEWFLWIRGERINLIK